MEQIIKTRQDFQGLSYYTLCRLQNATKYADPINGLPVAIARGEFAGILETDSLGNYRSFR
jgi:hypothetical protein